MIVCTACEKPMRRNAYCWSIGWDRPEGYAKKKFEVSFHNTPKCIGTMIDRLHEYAWEQSMAAVIESSGIGFDYE